MSRVKKLLNICTESQGAEGLIVSFDNKNNLDKAVKVIKSSEFSMDDSDRLSIFFKEDDVDALEMALDKLFIKKNITGYSFESGEWN
jgi:hypothetical protein